MQQHPLPIALSPRVNRFQCQLGLHKYSARGIVADYQIKLATRVVDTETVIEETEDLFEAVCALYTDYIFKARLVALCEYERFSNDGEVIGTETYHHASGQSDWCSVWVAEGFYRKHMLIIAHRIEEFLRNGSSLRFIGYKHIHIAISVAGGGNRLC